MRFCLQMRKILGFLTQEMNVMSICLTQFLDSSHVCGNETLTQLCWNCNPVLGYGYPYQAKYPRVSEETTFPSVNSLLTPIHFDVSEEISLNSSSLLISSPSAIACSISTDLHDVPAIFDISTPNISSCSVEEECMENIFELNPFADPFIAHHNEMHSSPTSNDMESASDMENSAYSILKKLRVNNVDKIIVGHININSIRNKIHLFADLIQDKIDIIVISETKLDCTFPKPQFKIPGYSLPFRLDRNKNGGGLLLYMRIDIPSHQLTLTYEGIECIVCEIVISKTKWLLMGTYNPHKTMISNHLLILGKNLGHYLPSYDNVIVLGDLNCEINEEPMSEFCSLFNLKSLIKKPTCFKNPDNPSCIDLILTNKPHSFQNSTVLETGLSDFHKLTVTLMRTSFRKKPPKVILYRDYKYYSSIHFCNELNFYLSEVDLNYISNDEYVSLVLKFFNTHAPLKQRYVRANDCPFMTNELRKEHMKRSRLRNKFLREKSEESARDYKKQRNKCVSLLKKVKKTYFKNLNPSAICDNKKFWKTVKPLFTEKTTSTNNITLVENNEIISDDNVAAEIFNDFFSNAVKNLNIEPYELFSFDKFFLCEEDIDDDHIQNAIHMKSTQVF